jgi:nucleoside-diphosphate-sugar epimerase
MNVVTGASGFIGSHLVDRLIARGEPVAACVLPGSDLRWLEGKPVELRPVDLVSGEGVREAIADASVLYHLAGLTGLATEEQFRRVNTEASARLGQAALDAAPGLRRFVYVSSTIGLGPSPAGGALAEDCVPRPITTYGQSKQAAEQALRAIDGLPLAIVRPPSVYGPRDPTLLPLFRMVESGVFVIVGTGQQRISTIFVDDLVKGLIAVGEGPHAGVFHFAGEALNWFQISDLLAEVMGARPVRVRVPGWLAYSVAATIEVVGSSIGRPSSITRRKIREMLAPGWVCSAERARELLGFTPTTPHAEGYQRTVDWYVEVGWLAPRAGRRPRPVPS